MPDQNATLQLSAVNKIDISKRRKGFERAAETYNESAQLQQEIASRLIERLDYMAIQPQRILDLGAGTGFVTHALKKKYPKAEVYAYDIALSMLKYNKKTAPWLKKPTLVCGMAEQLPFAGQSFDLVISNFMLQWCENLAEVFSDIARVIKPQGALLFTTFGPDSLKELRESWKKIDSYPRIHEFADMHDVGDAMLKAGLQQPVMDMEYVAMTYPSVMGILKDLKQIGATNAATERQKSMTGRQVFKRLEQEYQQYQLESGQYPISYEVLYGHAWGMPEILDSADLMGGKKDMNIPGQVIPVYPAKD